MRKGGKFPRMQSDSSLIALPTAIFGRKGHNYVSTITARDFVGRTATMTKPMMNCPATSTTVQQSHDETMFMG
jgi:hypothetical protein